MLHQDTDCNIAVRGTLSGNKGQGAMKHSIEIGGLQRDIDIRPMDEDFIVYRKMYVPPLTRENISQINSGDWRDHLEEFKRAGWQQLIQEFLRRQVRALGSCAMLGWDGNGVVAKMHFTTAEIYDAFKARGGCYCIESRSMPTVIESLEDGEVAELLKSPSRTLRILCFNVGHLDQRYHGQGIATALIEYLKRWARERGWRRILTDSCPDITPPTIVGAHLLRRGALERRGFRVLESSLASPEQAQARLRAIEAFASSAKDHPAGADWYVRNFARHYATISWRSEYDLDHVMACDL
jgi:GNAT superfamily N-acetyltransferase